jgi:transcriptional regulator with XRE-family HTH domain
MLTPEGAAVSKNTSRGAVAPGDLKIHDFISKQIDVVKAASGKTQREIAAEVGYEKPNMIAMMRAGDVKVPLDKVPALAKALHVDPAFLLRLAMNQYWPEMADAIAQIFGTICTANEVEILEHIRKVSKNTDPALNRDLAAKLRAAFSV